MLDPAIRRPESRGSRATQQLVERLIAAGAMTPVGLTRPGAHRPTAGDVAAARVIEDFRVSAVGARMDGPPWGIDVDVSGRTRSIAVRVLVFAEEHHPVQPDAALGGSLLLYEADARFEVLAVSVHLFPLEAPSQLDELIAALWLAPAGRRGHTGPARSVFTGLWPDGSGR